MKGCHTDEGSEEAFAEDVKKAGLSNLSSSVGWIHRWYWGGPFGDRDAPMPVTSVSRLDMNGGVATILRRLSLHY